MKKIKLSIITTTILMVICILLTSFSSLRSGNIIFTMKDKKHDDNGAGKLEYPLELKEYKGIFDLTSFYVREEKDNIIFEYNLNDINNRYNNKNGFSNVLIDTYINVDDKGLYDTVEYGAAVTFNSDYPWKYHIRITPEDYYVEKVTNTENRIVEKIDCSFEIKDTKLSITTNKKNINENLKKSKYYVFTGGFDIFGSDNFRDVVSKEDQWNFYGGIDSLYQPNIIDIVSPIQEDMLVYFMPPMYSIISPVFNQIHQLIFRKELVYILIAIFFSFKYYSIYKRYRNFSIESTTDNPKQKDA